MADDTEFLLPFRTEKVSRCRRPNQSHDTFGDHRPVEDRTPLFLIGHATGHQWRLRSMEARYGAACDTDKQHRENRRSPSIGMHILHAVGNLGNTRKLYQQYTKYADGHEQQSCREERIYAPDNLVYREQSSHDVINKNDINPESRIEMLWRQHRQQLGRPCNKDRPHENHQYDGKAPHNLFGRKAQIAADGLRKALPVMTYRNHPQQIIMHSPRKDSTEDNP